MAIRVAHIGTGNVGGLALTELITNPAFELTGVYVSSPRKWATMPESYAESVWTPTPSPVSKPSTTSTR